MPEPGLPAEPASARKRDREASRRALLAAGIEIFSAQGYDAATTRAIAAAAGLNEQLISRYFGGKAGLLAAIYVDFLTTRDNDGLYEAEPLGDSAEAEIRHFMRFKHRHIVAIDKLLRIVMPRLILDPSLAPMLNHGPGLRGAEVLAGRLDRLKAMGLVEPQADSRRIALIVAMQSISLSFLVRTMSGGKEGEVLRLIDLFAASMAGGIARGGGE